MCIRFVHLVWKLTFDFLTLKVLSESRLTWAICLPILVFLARPLCSRVRLDVRDMQSDRRQTSAVVKVAQALPPRSDLSPYNQGRIQKFHWGEGGGGHEALQAPRGVGCGEGVPPSHRGSGLGRGCAPSPDDFFNIAL